MAGITQPVEPTFSRTYSFGENEFGIIRLVTDHQLDFLGIKATESDDYYTTEYVSGSDLYIYDATNGVFTIDNVNGTYYKYQIQNMKYYTDDIKDIRDVYARVRPVEIRFPDRKFYDASKVHVRFGIAKEVLFAGNSETDATLRVFDGAWNISNQTNWDTDVTVEQTLHTYEVPEDVNGGTITYARVNGLRSYLLRQLPLATDTSTGCSFEIGMTNEGRVFDYTISAIPSNME